MFAKGVKVKKIIKINNGTDTFSAPFLPIVRLDCLVRYITRQRPGAAKTFSVCFITHSCGVTQLRHMESQKYSGCRLFAHVIQCCWEKVTKNHKHRHNACQSTAPGCRSSVLASSHCTCGPFSFYVKRRKKKHYYNVSQTVLLKAAQRPLFISTTPSSFIFHQAGLLIKMLNGTL